MMGSCSTKRAEEEPTAGGVAKRPKAAHDEDLASARTASPSARKMAGSGAELKMRVERYLVKAGYIKDPRNLVPFSEEPIAQPSNRVRFRSAFDQAVALLNERNMILEKFHAMGYAFEKVEAQEEGN